MAFGLLVASIHWMLTSNDPGPIMRMKEEEILLLQLLEEFAPNASSKKIRKQLELLGWSWPDGQISFHASRNPKQKPILLAPFVDALPSLTVGMQQWYDTTITRKLVAAVGEEYRVADFRPETISLPEHFCRLIRAIGAGEEKPTLMWTYADEDMFLGMRLRSTVDDYTLVVTRLDLPKGRK